MRRFMIAGAAFLLGTAILGESNIAFGAQQDASPAPGQTPGPPDPETSIRPDGRCHCGRLKGNRDWDTGDLGRLSRYCTVCEIP